MSDRTRRPRGAPLNHVPEAVKFARQRAGLTQEALAKQVGISRQLMCDIEAGRRSAVPAKLRKISRVLNCPIVVLEARRAGVPPSAFEGRRTA
ncbi:hypothetical protein SUDANB1_05578 [Streptomyces sp. enrichment culture]|uniref:helix-turn-helix transcriptional regulator n=1 Tax=Streptomyces sp. enrichment culture TaxID=1795815 RepID=UPI003F575791